MALRSSYQSAVAFSLGVHAGLILMMVLLWKTMPSDVDAPPVTMELIPVQVVDTGEMVMPEALQEQAALPPPAAIDPGKPVAEPAWAQQQPLTNPLAVWQGAAASEFVPSIATGRMEANITAAAGTTVQAQASPSATGTELPAPTSARIISGALPAYPVAARKSRWEGAVIVRVLVDTDGSAADVQVRDSSGMDIFDEAAVRAVRRWRFSPATQGGKAVVSYHDVLVRFHLNES